MLQIIGSILGFLLVCYGIWQLRLKFPVVERHWKDAYIWTFIAIVLIHVGIWWQWPDFWKEWYVQSGFLFFQILCGIGLYLRLGLKDKKFLKHLALAIICLGVIGIGWNVLSAFKLTRSANTLMSPSVLGKIPSQNKNVEKEVTAFWKKHLPEQNALAMLRIVRRQSGFNQFATSDVRTPYRNKIFDYKRVGVMQIDDSLWSERATELDDNLYELHGNLKFALWLYQQNGFTPWESPSEDIQNKNTGILAVLFPSRRQSSAPEPVFPDIPACADPRVVALAREHYKEYPFLVAVMARESGFRQFESKTDCAPIDSKPLQARLDNGEKGTALGLLQIKPELHEAFCTSKGFDLRTISGNWDCGVAMFTSNAPELGANPWTPEKGGVLEFDMVVEKKLWTRQMRLPAIDVNYSCGNEVEVNGDTFPKPLPCGPGKRVATPLAHALQFRSLESDTSIVHFIYAYPPRLSAKK